MTNSIHNALRHINRLRTTPSLPPPPLTKRLLSTLRSKKPSPRSQPASSSAVPATLVSSHHHHPLTSAPTQPQTKKTQFSTSALVPRSMSSDDAYLAFLEKANQQASAAETTSSSSAAASGFCVTRTVDESQAVPRALADIDGEVYFVSETDEAFEPVVLGWEGAREGRWPSDDEFKSLIFPTPAPPNDADISIESLSPASFDPQNRYAAVRKAVNVAAAGGDEDAAKNKENELRIWRVGFGASRAEYWVLGLDGEKARIVGMKAKAVES
ncbi:hypothetical protein VTO42DRAFT_496 [Malbranchea cinnamomea]